MSEQKLLFFDITPKSNSSTSVEGGAEKPLWARSDNTFRFNFLSEGSPAPQTQSSPSDRTEPSVSRVSYTGQGSFSFNFQIPPVAPEEDMSTEPSEAASPSSQHCVRDEKPSNRQEVAPPSEPSVSSKTKKKKKPGKKKASSGAEAQHAPAEGNQEGKNTELSAEEQLKRELDWCIEQLELGMKTQNATPKQKEDASRAVKTLRSSKAPLAKKRQVMRAMTGDYRKKMEDARSKQFKLLQSERASVQVKAVSDSPKKSVFHRKAGVKTQTPALEQPETKDTSVNTERAEGETSAFVFTTSKEEFRFNFL